jgi:epoxyqueuosine reductase
VDQLTARLKEQALGEGFDLVGVAAAGDAGSAPELRRWLAAGRHGGMAWMERDAELRADPRRLLPGCRSVVAVAMSYRTSHEPSLAAVRARDGRVWVSRYAWGRDYHRVLRARLVRLGRWLQAERPEAGWKVCVDTAPVLEREWAARAGLGWIGKSTSLLNRRLGSELFLGVLLSTLALEPDEPVRDHCGRCTACLDACPSAAFPEPRVLDARRCVAYLTIEHRGPVPVELRAAMGAMVAGCDICQEVCPWTRRAPADLHPEFAPAPHRYRPALAAMDALEEDGFRLWRQGSALSRIPYAQLRQSLAVARANLERPEDG